MADAVTAAPTSTISWEQAMPGMAPAGGGTAPAAGAAGAAPDASTSLPSLNPANSPYQPLVFPEAAPPVSPVEQRPQTPPDQLGAVTHAGAAAYLVDQGLRGIVEGHQRAEAFRNEKFNRHMVALSAISKQEGNQFKQLYADVGSEHPDWTQQQILQDPRVAAAKGRVDANFAATQETLKNYLPSLRMDKKTGKPKADQRGNLLERMFGAGDPHEAIRAYYDARGKLGPSVMYALPTQAQLQTLNQQRQAAQTEMQAGQAQLAATRSKAQIQSDLYDAAQRLNQATDPAARTALQQRIDTDTAALNPTRRLTSDEQKRADYQQLLETGQLPKDRQGNPLSYEAWGTYEAAQGRTTGAIPKPLKYDNNTGTVADLNTGETYSPNALDLPLPVAAMFKAADNQAFKKQQRALQLVQERGQAYLLGKVVQVPDPNNPNQAIYMRALDAIKQGVPSTASIWYKMAMPTGQERARADLAISAREQLNTMAQILERRKDLFGPEAGRKTDFTRWIGSQDPDAQRFAAAARIASDHLAGVFGGRSNAALQGIYDAIGQNKTNPSAAVAALEQMNVAAAAIQGRGAAGGGVAQPGGGGAAAGTGTTPTAAPSAVPAQHKVGDIVEVHGQKVRITAIGKNGKAVGVPVK